MRLPTVSRTPPSPPPASVGCGPMRKRSKPKRVPTRWVTRAAAWPARKVWARDVGLGPARPARPAAAPPPPPAPGRCEQGQDLQLGQPLVGGELGVQPLQGAGEAEGDVVAPHLGARHQVDDRIDPVGVAEGEEPALDLVVVVGVEQRAARLDLDLAEDDRARQACPGCAGRRRPAGRRRCCAPAGRRAAATWTLSWVPARNSSVSATSRRWRWRALSRSCRVLGLDVLDDRRRGRAAPGRGPGRPPRSPPGRGRRRRAAGSPRDSGS